MRLLLVEDDFRLAEVVAEALSDYGYVVDVVSDGETGLEQARLAEYSIILTDVMLPKLDGIGLCQRLRSSGCQVPILMMTARDTSTDKVIGLDAGADDYLVKPVDLPELLARIRALLRRGSVTSTPVLACGDLRLNPSTYDVTYGSKSLDLTPKEFSMLELFLRSGRRVLSRQAIIGHLWDSEDPPSEESVKAHIKTLRQKLKLAGASEDLVETVRGIGYRLKE
ncbi:MAG: response regulator transcription factor [Cyanosarcina radialis HA8281-LM2]|jgi:DNA-binding response OmpR family regulator|nr:response regulator transcription factor [Cyanosarcina radialis HA8281-LM2]